MTTLTNNNIRGEDVGCRFFSTGNKELLLNHMTFDISEDATEGSDDICGQKRGDPYTVTNFWNVGFDGVMTNLDLVDEFLANILAKDSNTGENPAVVSFQAITKKAVTGTYVFTGCTRKPMNLTASSRADPFKFRSGFKCKNWVKSP